MQVVVVGDLPHVVVEEPPLRKQVVGDLLQARLHEGFLFVTRSGPMVAKNGHRNVTRVAIEDGEPKRLVESCVPWRHGRQFTKLTDFHQVRTLIECGSTLRQSVVPAKAGI